ncbi:MAG: hypothetical protein ABIY55_03260, partial [Kofleriaceae bacterium]
EAKSGQALGPSSVVLELADALAPYLGAASSREALAQITVRHPLHRYGAGSVPAILPAIGRERWGCTVRDALRAHLRAAGQPIPDEEGQLALLAHPAQAELRAQLGVVEPPAAPPVVAVTRPLTVANLRGFLEYPVQAWAQAVLGLDELPDDEALEQSDEPFHLGRAERAVMLREVFAAQLRDPGGPVDTRYDAAVKDRQLRGPFPVGVFAEAARALDLEVLTRWRDGLGLIAADGATRIGFGRASSPGAELLPALAIELSGGRTVRLIGQTELLIRGARYTSVVTLLRKLEKRSHYHLRGAFDHVMLAAAGLASAGHSHRLIDDRGDVVEIQHAPWTVADARGYLAGLIGELLDAPHGYLLPFEALAKALHGGKAPSWSSDPTRGLGYGPIERGDGLDPPADAVAIARRRLRPLVERMQGDHGFEVGP